MGSIIHLIIHHQGRLHHLPLLPPPAHYLLAAATKTRIDFKILTGRLRCGVNGPANIAITFSPQGGKRSIIDDKSQPVLFRDFPHTNDRLLLVMTAPASLSTAESPPQEKRLPLASWTAGGTEIVEAVLWRLT
ncbi:hypothetical protein EG329_012948 [Mollisiaceae sp. DMI_Dod_QoI]|nr:hypothetical protein EG329_012948 [Helotiales sp. DMI_Dod_QoI]